jgi:hypothetical protein
MLGLCSWEGRQRVIEPHGLWRWRRYPRVKAEVVVLSDGRAELGHAMMACSFGNWHIGVTAVVQGDV